MTAAGQSLQALIFDFDGVIVDTEHLHWEAFNQLLEPLGLGISWDLYRQVYMGFDDRGVFQRVHREHDRALSPAGQQALVDRKAQVFIQLAEGASLAPFPGVIELIREAAARLPVALCTGALASDIDPILRNLELDGAFTVRVTADEVTESKPDPESYKRVLSKLAQTMGSSPDAERCVAIEDTPTGIAAAKGAGLRVAAVTNSYTASELQAADWILDSLVPVSCGTLAAWVAG